MALTTKQQNLAHILCDYPELKRSEQAQRAGVGDSTLYRCLNNDEFMEYFHSLCQSRFKKLEALAIEKLTENIESNNQKAIEYALNYLGYKPVEKIEATTTSISITIGDENGDKAKPEE